MDISNDDLFDGELLSTTETAKRCYQYEIGDNITVYNAHEEIYGQHEALVCCGRTYIKNER